MKIFEKGGKDNFIDKNNVLVGFSMSASCCENFGWFISPTKEQEIKKMKIPNVSNYVFDTNFFEKIDCDDFEDGGIVIFRLVNGDKQLFLHLYNSHNGYYSHGFNMEVDGKNIQDDCI